MTSERYTQKDRGMPVVAIPGTLGRYFTEADLDRYVAERCAPLVAALERIANDPRGSAYVLVARDALRAYRADEGGADG